MSNFLYRSLLVLSLVAVAVLSGIVGTRGWVGYTYQRVAVPLEVPAMAGETWLNSDGEVLMDADGAEIVCDECPCPSHTCCRVGDCCFSNLSTVSVTWSADCDSGDCEACDGLLSGTITGIPVFSCNENSVITWEKEDAGRTIQVTYQAGTWHMNVSAGGNCNPAFYTNSTNCCGVSGAAGSVTDFAMGSTLSNGQLEITVSNNKCCLDGETCNKTTDDRCPNYGDGLCDEGI